MKQCTLTGRKDKNGKDIFVGDIVRSYTTGKTYVVNAYGMPQNETSGSTKWQLIGDFEVVGAASESASTDSAAEEVAVQEPEVESLSADDESPEAEKKDFSALNDDELLEELRSRGYSGTLVKRMVVCRQVTV